MKKQNHSTAIAAAIGLLVLIFGSNTALRGGRDGITLCLSTLIPSLYPFIFLSIILTGSLRGLALPFLRPIAKFCKMPTGSEAIIAISFLGGYPVGAQCISLLKKQEQLTDAAAMRMIGFCNNAGPAFIFGILGTMFSDRKTVWFLWLVNILSALLVGYLLPGTASKNNIKQLEGSMSIMDSFTLATRAMASICGWVILMKMVLAFIEPWLIRYLPQPAQILAIGALELSNGCIRISDLECEGLRFLIASALLSLGGFCVTLQTISVSDSIPLRLYFPGKILQCCITILLSSLFQFLFPFSARYDCRAISAIAICITVIFLLFLKESEKSSRISVVISV